MCSTRLTALAFVLSLSLAGCGTAPSPSDAGADAEPACTADEQCDDGLFCTDVARCAPGTAGADAQGCVAGASPCAGGAVCDEEADRCLETCEVDGDRDDDGHDSIACDGDDCDDDDADRYPGNPEVCDGADHDEDCDARTYGARDADGDTFPDALCCNVDGESGAMICGVDCDDARAASHPGSTEACNTFDDDCDGAIDEAVLRSFHPDVDGDGYGAAGSVAVRACVPGAGLVENATDCDDTTSLRNPATSEICDGIDNNCNELIDEAGMRSLYRDADEDGHGDPGNTMSSLDCVIPAGYVAVGDDCDDADDAIYTGAPERCDLVDQDCSIAGAGAGGADPAEDADGDGHSPIALGCSGGLPTDDCDDAEPHAHGGAAEVCDGIDNDCDGDVDPAASVDPWCGPGAGCDAGACVDRRTLAVGSSFHGCSIEGGSAHCWGSNSHGQLGRGDTLRADEAVPVMGLAAPRSIGTGGRYSCALTDAGTIVCWGDEAYIGEPDGFDLRLAPGAPMPGISGAAGLSLRLYSACLRLRDGTVRCWGSNGASQLGDGTTIFSATPVSVIGIDDAQQVSTGGEFACVRRRDSSVWCWGDNTSAQLGRGPSPGVTATPAPVAGLADVRQVEAGAYHACALDTAGAVWCWGSNYGGAIDGTSGLDASTPRELTALDCDAAEIATGFDASCARCVDGRVQCWGAGLTVPEGRYTSAGRGPIAVPGLTDATELSLRGTTACARRASGGIVCWGATDEGVRGDGGGLVARRVPGLAGVTAIDAGHSNACAVAAGRLYCWGRGDNGLVAGAFDSQAAIEHVGLAPVSAIAAGHDHLCVVRGAGEVHCWGGNGQGQLGDGTATARPTPQRVAMLGTVTSLGAGQYHTCATEDDGDVFCWGGGLAGQIGDGATMQRRAPTLAMIQASTVLVGEDHSCVPTASGVACWGRGGSGQLGRGTLTSSGVPADVMGLAAAPSLLAVGFSHSCALVSGTLRCWGIGARGVLGDGATVNRSTPVDGPALSGVVGLAAGLIQTCAIVAGGEVRCWGGEPALGNGLMTDSRTPVAVRYVSGATAIAAGRRHTCAIVAGGEVMCWGDDNEGQLGRGIVSEVIGLP